ncbi:MAG: GNAT family N-acetyltransferase [Clostridiales bacterium]|nr:GNAT family N-acetyltransferase [Clostridiales bacterium]
MEREMTYRYAVECDVPLILDFVQKLAQYENMLDDVIATEELLKEWLFERKKAEVLFLVVDGKEIGFALFFHNFSTFLGRAGIYLEDLYILEEYRSNGYGKAMLQKLAQITVERGCGRLEWWCLDWNQPSIDFYRSMGAQAMNEWTTYRLSGETLRKAAGGSGE